ncbi:MAG TPA: FAD-dependent monooxygenase [Armatimonadota bacterium]|mgnify:CR=1 FL=1|nr:FAD-dependent monooxygenase [Armatimonadota bacterium]
MFDVAIVGAGPAGAMLARQLGRACRVLLVERRRGDGADRGKCCGGLLTPGAQEALAACGLTVPADVLASSQPAHVRVLDVDNGLDRVMPRRYLNCHRGRLEHWLRAQAGAAELRLGTALCGFTEEADGVTLALRDGDRHSTERVRLLVGADGAASRVRQLAGPAIARPQAYLALQSWLEGAAPDCHSAIFDRTVTDFYGWTVAKDGLLLVGAALTPRREPAARFARLVERLRGMDYRFGRTVRREAALVLRPSPGAIWTGAGRVLLIGEAAGWINPSSAEGFSYAFRSAAALAQALDGGPEGAAARYARLTAPLRQEIRGNAVKAAFLSTPWLRGPIVSWTTAPFHGRHEPMAEGDAAYTVG